MNSAALRAIHRVTGVLALTALCTLGCREEAPPITDLRVHPPVAGYELRLASGYAAQAHERGWTITPASGLRDIREPIEIDVDVVKGPAPEDGSTERVGERRLRRSVKISEGGSSGDAVTLTYVEALGPDHVRYQQVRHADGVAPRFELDELVRRGGLSVKTSPGGKPE